MAHTYSFHTIRHIEVPVVDRADQGRLRELFGEEEMSSLMHPTGGTWQYDDKLKLASSFMEAAADCIEPMTLQIVDPNRLLVRFEEVYLVSRRIVAAFNGEYAQRISGLESALNLSQNAIMLGSISSRVSLSDADLFLSRIFRGVLRAGHRDARLTFPDREPARLSFSSLLEIRTALHRMSGLLSTASTMAGEWWRKEEDVVVVDGFYDPRKVPKLGIRYVVVTAIEALSDATDVPEEAKVVVLRELQQVVVELDDDKTPWSKVLSRLTQATMVLAAVITIIGGADEASENLSNAYERTRQAVQAIQDQALVFSRYLIPGDGDGRRSLPAPRETPMREDVDFEIQSESEQ